MKDIDSKQLPKEQGCNVTYQYSEADKVSALFCKSLLGESSKRIYYELVTKRNKVIYVVEDKTLALSLAGRFNLNYREVEFTVKFEETKKDESKNYRN